MKFGDFKEAECVIGWPYSQEESEWIAEEVAARVESFFDKAHSNCIVLNRRKGGAMVGKVFFPDYAVYVVEEKEL